VNTAVNLREMREISCLAGQLLASQAGLCPMELVSQLLKISVIFAVV
jgi:hypothetical protein